MSSNQFPSDDTHSAISPTSSNNTTHLRALTRPVTDETQALLSQADALMRRHRVFVAGADRAVQTTESGDADAATDDLPLLTEVVETSGLASGVSVVGRSKVDDHEPQVVASAIDKWVESELTATINALVGEFNEKLGAALTASAKQNLLEYVTKELESRKQR